MNKSLKKIIRELSLLHDDSISDYYQYLNEFSRKCKQWDKYKNNFQVEIHPGYSCDIYNCSYCYGYGQDITKGEKLEIGDYNKLFDDLVGHTPLIDISGICTEPTTNPNIADIVHSIKKRNFQCGIHTKALLFTNDLIESLTDDFKVDSSFVTISIDSSNPEHYNKIHGINVSNKYDLNYYNRVLNNIKKLHKLKIKKNSSLSINVAYLIFNENKNIDLIEKFVSELKHYCNVIKLSLPQIRNDGCVPSNFIIKNRKKIINSLKNTYSESNKIRVLKDHTLEQSNKFKYCYAQIFQVVIDLNGNVFPCPQVATERYTNLCIGNVKNSSILKLLESKKRIELFHCLVDDLKCRICDRKDEAYNIYLNSIFDNEICKIQ